MKTRWIFFLIILLAGCGGQGSQPRRTADEGEPTPVPTPVIPLKPIYTVEQGDVRYQLAFSGRISAEKAAPLTAPMDGVVAQPLVEPGDPVAAGDVIALMDTAYLREQLALAQSDWDIANARLQAAAQQTAADLRRAEIALSIAELNLSHAQEAAGENPGPEQAYQIQLMGYQRELAQLDLDELSAGADPTLQAAVDQARLAVDEWGSLIERAVITAPMDGIAAALGITPGRAVAEGETVGIVADTSRLEVSSDINADLMRQLMEGMSAQISLSGGPGELLSGSVRRLPYPFGGGQSGFGEDDGSVRVQFDDPAQASAFAPGDRVMVTVLVDQRQDVLWLPRSAVRVFGGRYFVVIQEGEGQRRVDVELGIEGDGRVEIVSGLSQGQQVVGP